MTIEKINFSYPKGSLQSVFDDEAMTALELASKTSKKVDECVELVNGVEQSAIEATAIVDDMRTQQDQFITDNTDTRQQIIIDNQDYVDTLTASKVTFEGNMTTALGTFETELTASKTSFETDMTTALGTFETNTTTAKTTYENGLNDSKVVFDASMSSGIQTVITNSETVINTDVGTKVNALVADGTIGGLINTGLLGDINTNITNIQNSATTLNSDVTTHKTTVATSSILGHIKLGIIVGTAAEGNHTHDSLYSKLKQSKNFGNKFVKALGTRLSMALEDAGIAIFGDSTGDGTNEWVYTSMSWLASKFPKYTFKYLLWDDATQTYFAPIYIQMGNATNVWSSGTNDFVNLTGITGSYISTPDGSSLDIVGDIDIACKVSPTTWNSACALVSKFGNAGNRGWEFALTSTGQPYFWYSPDGTANSVIYANAINSAPDGVPLWLRVTVDVDNGAGGNTVKFYTSPDGTTWTQFGTDVVTTGVISFFSNNAPVELGSRSGGSSDMMTGKYYCARIKQGIEGTLVANPIIAPSTGQTFTDSTGKQWTVNGVVGTGAPTVTIYNASKSGAVIAYSTDSTRFDKQCPTECQLGMISYSHNEGTNTDYTAQYEALCTKILTKFPSCGVVCVTQNPQSSPEVNIIPHAIRNRQISQLCAKHDYGLIDVFRAFMETSNYVTLISDGTHPTQAGFDLWSSVVQDFLNPATP